MSDLYPFQAGSPLTTLDGNLAAGATEIPVVDVTILPVAPNIVTIFSEDKFETVLYGATDTGSNELRSVTRGFEGSDQAWDGGASIGRTITAYDMRTFRHPPIKAENGDAYALVLADDGKMVDLDSGVAEIAPTAATDDVEVRFVESGVLGNDYTVTIDADTTSIRALSVDLDHATQVFTIFLAVHDDSGHKIHSAVCTVDLVATAIEAYDEGDGQVFDVTFDPGDADDEYVSGDADTDIPFTAEAITLTVPKNSAQAFPIGTQIMLRQKGEGQVTIAPVDSDVTLNAADGALKTRERYSMAGLIKVATDVWAVTGDLDE